MPYHFEFDSTNQILCCRLDGQVTDEGLKEFYRVVADYVARTAPHAGILDMSGVTSFEVSTQTIRDLAMSPPAMPDPSSPRFIVAASPQIFGMARMFELQGQKTRPNLHIVRIQEEAWAALGVHQPKFEPIQK
jgi:hypothetical protein